MYSRLTYPKLFGSLSHSRIWIGDEVGNLYDPLFDIGLQRCPSFLHARVIYMWDVGGLEQKADSF